MKKFHFSRLAVVGLGIAIIILAAIIYVVRSGQPFASTLFSQSVGSVCGSTPNVNQFIDIAKNGQTKKANQGQTNKPNSRLFFQNGIAYDGSVGLSPSWHPNLFYVDSDGTETFLSDDLCLGIISAPAAMTDLFRSYSKYAYNGAAKATVEPGDHFRIRFNDQPYCRVTDFTIPDDYKVDKGQTRDIVVSPIDMREVGPLTPGAKSPTISSNAVYVPINYTECSRFGADKVAKEYTGVITKDRPTSTNVSIPNPYRLTIDDESTGVQGGGGAYQLSFLVGTSLDKNTALEAQIRDIYNAHPTYCPQTGCGESYYVTLKGKLGPEVRVGNTSSTNTMRTLQVESVVATGVNYTEVHTGTLQLDPNPSSVTGRKYVLLNNDYPQPYQHTHFIIPKGTDIDTKLKALVGKKVTVSGKRSHYGVGYFDTTDVAELAQ